MLDLIRLREPGEGEGAKAGRETVFHPHPVDFLPCVSAKASPGVQKAVSSVLLPQGHGGLSLLSLDKHFDLLAPILMSFLPTNQLPNRVCLSHPRLSLLRPCQGPKLDPRVQLAPT